MTFCVIIGSFLLEDEDAREVVDIDDEGRKERCV
jgi:hypothetical protein